MNVVNIPVSAVVWTACAFWTTLTGPVNVSGWICTVGIFLAAPLVGWLASLRLNRKAAR
jgi:hypothetical protein